MTDKQKRFADEYLIDCNATRAYKVAYPRTRSDVTAASSGAKLLRNCKVKPYIDEQMASMHEKKVARAGEVMEYLTSVLRGESESEVVVVEGVGEGCSEARSIRKGPDEMERLKAAELIGKRYGLFSTAVDLKGPVPVVISGEDRLED